MKFSLLGIVFLTIVLNSCNNENIPANFDYGRIENNTYINSFFDFEMTLPDGWVVQTKEQMENMANTGKTLVAGDNSKMKAILKASEINTANLLSVFQFEQGAAVMYNPSITLIAENLKNFPGIKNGNDYLFHAKKLIEQSQFKYDYVDDKFSKEMIDGVEFYKMHTEVEYMGIDIKQIYYSTILKGFSFNAIISYNDDQQKQELLNLLNSMNFKN